MTQDEGDETSQPEVGYTPPPADECEEHGYYTPLGDEGDILHFRHCWDLAGRMADFAVIQMSTLGGHLRRVAEADIRHGNLHVHVLNQQEERIGRPESLRPVITQQDVEDAYDVAVDLFMAKWEEYKRRWRNG
jgi:hypothetical protein